VGVGGEEGGVDWGGAQRLEVGARLVRDLEQMLADFIAEAPTFEMGHGFFEGKYALSMSYDEPFLDEGRGLRKHFSRINFLLDPCSADGSFSITAKITVRDRDLPQSSDTGHRVRADDGERRKKFAGGQPLRFATEYFATRIPAPPVQTSAN